MAKHTVNAQHAKISLLNEGAEIQEVVLLLSNFNQEKKRTYGLVTLVHCINKKPFLCPLCYSIHTLSLGTLEAEQLPKQIMAFAAQCFFAIALFFLSLRAEASLGGEGNAIRPSFKTLTGVRRDFGTQGRMQECWLCQPSPSLSCHPEGAAAGNCSSWPGLYASVSLAVKERQQRGWKSIAAKGTLP